MPRSLIPLRTYALVALLTASGVLGYRQATRFLHGDPFADLMEKRADNPVGISMRGVAFRHYHGTELITYAKADQVDFSRDQSTVDITGVHDGTYRDGDQVFRYDARRAQWQATARILSVGGSVHIVNADVDLRTPNAIFDARNKLLRVPGQVAGRLGKGQVTAQELRYAVNTKAYQTGPLTWEGMLALSLDPQNPESPRRWSFKAEASNHLGTGTDTMEYRTARASDGEVIVLAPRIVHNQRTDVLEASGRVQYFSGKSNFVADSVVIYRREKRAIFTGHVQMLVKPKSEENNKPKIEQMPAFQPLAPDQVKADPPKSKLPPEKKDQVDQIRNTKSLRDYPIVVVSDKIEYWYSRGSRRAVITGNPQGRQTLPNNAWRHLWSYVGYYDGEKETLRLVSSQGKTDTHIKNSLGDDFVTSWFLVSTKEDDETYASGPMEGEMSSFEDDEDPRDPTPIGPPPATNPTTGPATPPTRVKI